MSNYFITNAINQAYPNNQPVNLEHVVTMFKSDDVDVYEIGFDGIGYRVVWEFNTSHYRDEVWKDITNDFSKFG